MQGAQQKMEHASNQNAYGIDFDSPEPQHMRGAALDWDREGLLDSLRNAPNNILSWRIIPRLLKEEELRSIRECECDTVLATLDQFLEWRSGNCGTKNPLHDLSSKKFCLYADYKYLREIFITAADDFDYSDDGDTEINNLDSSFNACKDSMKWKSLVAGCKYILEDEQLSDENATIWLGSPGVHTPLHYDTYGTNVVVQLQGNKRWQLWYNTNAKFMENGKQRPLRVPYEESSVFTSFDPLKDISAEPDFDIILNPGDVLYVPRKFWHFVSTCSKDEESLNMSCNMWLPHPADERERLSEALTRLSFASLVTQPSNTVQRDLVRCGWVCPSESTELNCMEGSVNAGFTSKAGQESWQYIYSLLINCDEEEVENRTELMERVMKAVVEELTSPDLIELAATRLSQRALLMNNSADDSK